MADGDGTRRDLADEDWVHAAPLRGSESGLGDFERSRWTFDDEIEGLEASSDGVHRAPGWTRIVAVLVAVAMLLPLLVAVVYSILG